MKAESNLNIILKSLNPKLHDGEFVFCTMNEISTIDNNDIVMIFRETEGITLILGKETADRLKLDYSFIAAWITLTVHSSLEAIGLTAFFSNALAREGISCNVVAAFYHDHLFVKKEDAAKSMEILIKISE
jgi:hypothetical protein